LIRYRPPAEGTTDGVTVRNDTGVYEGGEISIYYDPMIAKLVTHAADRPTAIEAQAEALDAFCIEGIRHNIPFLSALMRHPRWREARLSTGFIAEEFPEGFKIPAPEGETLRAVATVAAHVDYVANARKRQISGQLREPKRFAFDVERVVALGAQRVALTVEPQADGVVAAFADGGRIAVVSDWRPGEPVWRGALDGRPVAALLKPLLNGMEIGLRGTLSPTRVYTAREAELAGLMRERKGADEAATLKCPMPGLVKSIAVKEGQDVKTGEALCMVEAMKMENVLVAERDLKIKKILAKPGDSLAVDAVIMEFG
jgi:propionyl-CoA carboxylase alpha chain